MGKICMLLTGFLIFSSSSFAQTDVVEQAIRDAKKADVSSGDKEKSLKEIKNVVKN